MKNLTEKEDGIMNAQSVLSSISSDRGLWLAQYHAEVKYFALKRAVLFAAVFALTLLSGTVLSCSDDSESDESFTSAPVTSTSF